MKVTSGKLQVGDKIHFKNGTVDTVGDHWCLNDSPCINAEWWLRIGETNVTKITRKQPKKKLGEMIEEMVKSGNDVKLWVDMGSTEWARCTVTSKNDCSTYYGNSAKMVVEAAYKELKKAGEL